jgi:hypothetical protein
MGGMTLESTEVRGDSALTRTELLRDRGYDETVIAGHNGNGHAPKSSEKEVLPDNSMSARCSQCSKPAVPGRPTCGARDCVDGHRRAKKRAAYRNGTGPAPVPPATGVKERSFTAPVDVVAFAEAIFNAYGPRTELELTTPALTVVFHPRGRT